MRNRILTIKQNGKRIIVDGQYCKVGSIYPKSKKNENQKKQI